MQIIMMGQGHILHEKLLRTRQAMQVVPIQSNIFCLHVAGYDFLRMHGSSLEVGLLQSLYSLMQAFHRFVSEMN